MSTRVMRGHLWVLAVAALLLSGCGETRGERAVTGAGVGAGAGALVGAVTGLGPGTGALVGATAGGIAGFLTEKAELNLGDAPWDSSDDSDSESSGSTTAAQAAEPQTDQAAAQPAQESTAAAESKPAQEAAAVEPAAGRPSAGPDYKEQAYAGTPADRETIRDIQTGLKNLGFDPGPVDGIPGTQTRDAIREFQKANGLPVDGWPTKELAAEIQQKLVAN